MENCWAEWVTVDEEDKLLVLGVPAEVEGLVLYIYDPATGSWSEGAAPPADLRDAADYGTTVWANTLCVVARQPPIGNDLGVWQYDPATNAWALKAQRDYTPGHYGSPMLVAGNDGSLYIVVRGTARSGFYGTFTYATWAVYELDGSWQWGSEAVGGREVPDPAICVWAFSGDSYWRAAMPHELHAES
ncbi:MAG: hypothetical protein U9R79_02860, partial [Armatimonadota bacterium]|nr:hypothetical protein [Armatimonadota bacterium]